MWIYSYWRATTVYVGANRVISHRLCVLWTAAKISEFEPQKSVESTLHVSRAPLSAEPRTEVEAHQDARLFTWALARTTTLNTFAIYSGVGRLGPFSEHRAPHHSVPPSCTIPVALSPESLVCTLREPNKVWPASPLLCLRGEMLLTQSDCGFMIHCNEIFVH